MASVPHEPLGPIEPSLLDVDYFQGMLVRAGVPPEKLPESNRSLSPEQAVGLLSWVLTAEVGLRDFGPWRMAAHLLWEVVQGGSPVSREVLRERMRRFVPLLVLRPDGYLVKATTGRAIQFAGEVRLERGLLCAEGFQVGPFYTLRGQYLYPVEGDLAIHPDAVMAGVYAPQEGTFGPVLEGAGEAVVDSVTGVLGLVLHPMESLEALTQLPGAVRALLENSPEYWVRFRAMPHAAQVRSVSRLLTQVLITVGTAGAGSAHIASVGSRLGKLGVPVLSLSEEGLLSLRLVAVPAGQLVTAMGPAAGAFYILHMSNTGNGGGGGGRSRNPAPPPPGGPGQWVKKAEGMSDEARRYQAQVTGTPEGWVYRVFKAKSPDDYVDFDGFQNGVLLECKGPNLAKFIDGDLEPLWFFEGAEAMLRQARNQYKVARGVPIRWVVAEKRLKDYLRKLFNTNGLDKIEVIHISAKS